MDTAGQEEFDALKDTYIRSGDGYVIVYSITSEASFIEANEVRERVFRVLDKDLSEHVPMILVGNKVDLQPERKVTAEEVKELADSWGINFIEVSAKDNPNSFNVSKIAANALGASTTCKA